MCCVPNTLCQCDSSAPLGEVNKGDAIASLLAARAAQTLRSRID